MVTQCYLLRSQKDQRGHAQLVRLGGLSRVLTAWRIRSRAVRSLSRGHPKFNRMSPAPFHLTVPPASVQTKASAHDDAGPCIEPFRLGFFRHLSFLASGLMASPYRGRLGGRSIPSFPIRYRKVLGFKPKRSAALSGPLTFQPHSSRTPTM